MLKEERDRNLVREQDDPTSPLSTSFLPSLLCYHVVAALFVPSSIANHGESMMHSILMLHLVILSAAVILHTGHIICYYCPMHIKIPKKEDCRRFFQQITIEQQSSNPANDLCLKTFLLRRRSPSTISYGPLKFGKRLY